MNLGSEENAGEEMRELRGERCVIDGGALTCIVGTRRGSLAGGQSLVSTSLATCPAFVYFVFARTNGRRGVSGEGGEVKGQAMGERSFRALFVRNK